jgi:hypothetical protein
MKFLQLKENFNSMEPFFIFREKSNKEKIIASKNGFCILALFLGPFWGIAKGLWIEGIFNIFVIFLINYYFFESLLFIIGISFLIWGFLGRDIYIQKLIRSKYYPDGIVSSTTPSKALITFLSKNK